MGSKFCNLNVRGPIEPEAEKALPPGVGIFPWDNGWTTLTDPEFQWGGVQNWAKKLSAVTEAAVLSTEYFDDDYVEFTVYKGGKRVARHVPVTYEDLRKSRGRPEKFLEALGLNLAEASRLKKIFQVADCELATVLMESFLGCPIFGVDEETPPTELPSPELSRSFAGEESPVRVTVTRRRPKTGQPPYAYTLDKPPDPAGVFETLFCYTDHPERVVEHLESLRNRWKKRLEGEERGWIDRITGVVAGDHLAVIREFPVVNVDVDLPDLSREFNCLAVACRVIVKGEDQVQVTVRGERRTLPLGGGQAAELTCGLAYGNRLLCFGRRGGDPRYAKIMPEVTLESPWLTLRAGELVEAIERQSFWDSVRGLGTLFGCPIYPASTEQQAET